MSDEECILNEVTKYQKFDDQVKSTVAILIIKVRITVVIIA